MDDGVSLARGPAIDICQDSTGGVGAGEAGTKEVLMTH